MKKFPNYFADAERSFKESRFVIFGLPYDKTSSFRFGSRLAPKEIRTASWNFESYDILIDFDLSKIPIHDYGNLDIEDKKSEDMIEHVSRFTRDLVNSKKIPIAIGGEHSVTPGIIKGFSDVEDLSIIVLDAHLDFRDKYEDNRYNHACTLRRISEYIDIRYVFTLGIRSAERQELKEAQDIGLKFFTVKDIESDGIEDVIKKIKEKIKDRNVYMSLDFDVIDPAYAPGVSTPEPFGLNPGDVIRIIEEFSENTIGFDLVEVCPPYDTGITSILAAKMIRIAIANIWKNNPYI